MLKSASPEVGDETVIVGDPDASFEVSFEVSRPDRGVTAPVPVGGAGACFVLTLDLAASSFFGGRPGPR